MAAAAFRGVKAARGPLKTLPLRLQALPPVDFFSLGFSLDFGQQPRRAIGGKLSHLDGCFAASRRKPSEMQEGKGELPALGAQHGQAAPRTVKSKECRRLSLPVLYLLTFLPGLVHGVHPRAHSSRIISCLQEPGVL